MFTCGTPKACRSALVDLDDLVTHFNLIFVGNPKFLRDLRHRIKTRRARGNLPVVSRDVVMTWLKFFERHGLTCYLNLTDDAMAKLRLRVQALPENDIPEQLVHTSVKFTEGAGLDAAEQRFEADDHAHAEQRPRADGDDVRRGAETLDAEADASTRAEARR